MKHGSSDDGGKEHRSLEKAVYEKLDMRSHDMAVLAAYGIKKGDPAYSSESACVAFLMKRYQELVAQKG